MAHSPYPQPRDFELKVAYLRRLNRDPLVQSSHPTPAQRRELGERLWTKAKTQSLVSVKTHKGEALLFGRL